MNTAKMPSAKPKSPTRLTTKALMAAAQAERDRSGATPGGADREEEPGARDQDREPETVGTEEGEVGDRGREVPEEVVEVHRKVVEREEADRPLLRDPGGIEPVRDRERDRVIGQDQVLVATGACRLRHRRDRVDPVGPVRVGVQIAPEVAPLDEAREPARERRLDLTAVLAELGLDAGEIEEGVRLSLRREGPQLALAAVLAEPQEALLRKAPAAVPGAPTEADVVLLRAGEVDQIGARLAGRRQ